MPVCMGINTMTCLQFVIVNAHTDLPFIFYPHMYVLLCVTTGDAIIIT